MSILLSSLVLPDLTDPVFGTPWRAGQCFDCLEPLDEQAMESTVNVGFCGEFCRHRAQDVRYVRRAIRDGRLTGPMDWDGMTARTLFTKIVVFIGLDLAYTRPRIQGALRTEVLSANKGRCVQCKKRKATEVDHIVDGSNARENLQGLCRPCHLLKPPPPIPADLTRHGDGAVDESFSDELMEAWRDAVYRQSIYSVEDPPPVWQTLLNEAQRVRDLSPQQTHRFATLTLSILSDQVDAPAHDDHWRDYRVLFAHLHRTRDYRDHRCRDPRPTPTLLQRLKTWDEEFTTPSRSAMALS